MDIGIALAPNDWPGQWVNRLQLIRQGASSGDSWDARARELDDRLRTLVRAPAPAAAPAPASPSLSG